MKPKSEIAWTEANATNGSGLDPAGPTESPCAHERRQFLRTSLAALGGLSLSACGGGEAESAPEPALQASSLDSPELTMQRASVSSQAPSAASEYLPQFLTYDGGSGPNSLYWSERLKLGWLNGRAGDWLDADQVSQGTKPYATASVALGWVQMEVTPLVQRWVDQGVNRGFYLRTNQDWSFHFAGRDHADASLRPVLEVVTDTGTLVLPCSSNAAWSPSSTASKNTRSRFEVSKKNWLAALQFDLNGLSGRVLRATVKLFCLQLKYPGSLYAFELNPPTFRIGGGSGPVQSGIAAQYPGDQGISGHGSVLFASDFAVIDRTRWQAGSVSPGYSQALESPGNGTCVRGVIAKGKLAGCDLERNVVGARPDGVPSGVETRLFARYMVYLEKDWGSPLQANKMPGWDGRFGWWNKAGNGYWQSTTGNGGNRGSGRKTRHPRTGVWNYEGCSMRGLGGRASFDGNPYDGLFTMANYMYHLDQATSFGEDCYWPGVVLSKERWFAIEQEIVMNTISGPYDELGNGVANPDGQYRVWVDGVMVWERTRLRWRCHPEMGIQGFWLDWYHGGTQAAASDMHFRMNSVVIAREYIGPRSAAAVSA